MLEEVFYVMISLGIVGVVLWIYTRRSVKELEVLSENAIKSLEYYEIVEDQRVQEFGEKVRKLGSIVNLKVIGKKIVGIFLLISLLIILYWLLVAKSNDIILLFFTSLVCALLTFVIYQSGLLVAIKQKAKELKEKTQKIVDAFKNSFENMFLYNSVNIIMAGDFPKAPTKYLVDLGPKVTLVSMPSLNTIYEKKSEGAMKPFLSCLGELQREVINFIMEERKEREDEILSISGTVEDKKVLVAAKKVPGAKITQIGIFFGRR